MKQEQIARNFKILEDIVKGHISFNPALLDYEFIEIVLAASGKLYTSKQSCIKQRHLGEYYYMGGDKLKSKFRRGDDNT